MSKRFAPSLTMTICVALAMIVLLGLGTWQVQRLFWKQELITRYTDNSTAPVEDWHLFRPLFKAGDMTNNEFRRVRVQGEFLHQHEMYMTGRSRIGEPGLYVFTPMRLNTNEVVLINRGWIPSEYRPPETRIDGLYQGQVTLEGLFRLAQPVAGIRAAVLPENDMIKNTWYTLDLPMMAEHTGLELQQDYYLMDGREGAPRPYGHQWQIRLHNNHLEYVVTWYGLALALLVMFIAFGIKRAKELET